MAKRGIDKENVNFRMPSDLLERLDRWIEAQRVQPGRSDVMITALREFLDREKSDARPPKR